MKIDDPTIVTTKLCRRQSQANDQNVDCRWTPVKLNEGTVSSSESVQRLIKKLDISRLSRPTKQTLLRQGSEKNSYEFNKTLESIGKL